MCVNECKYRLNENLYNPKQQWTHVNAFVNVKNLFTVVLVKWVYMCNLITCDCKFHEICEIGEHLDIKHRDVKNVYFL